MRYVNRFLSWFRGGARTVGLSPKILAPVIGSAITAALAAVGVSPHDVAALVGVSDEVATAGMLAVAANVALWLLPPGAVVVPTPVAPSSDELIAAAVPPADK